MVARLLIAFFIVLAGCGREDTRQKFNRYYAQWQRECDQPKVPIMSDSRAFTNLPGYRAIVELGHPALPYLREKMEHDSGFDFMLAYAAIEIEGWKERDFPDNLRGVQGLRDDVLARMQAQQ
jgi:hypothetical protein